MVSPPVGRWPRSPGGQPWLQICTFLGVTSALIVWFAVGGPFTGAARAVAIVLSPVVGWLAIFPAVLLAGYVSVWRDNRRFRRDPEGFWRDKGLPGPGPRPPPAAGPSGGAGVREPRRPYPSGPPPAHEAVDSPEE
jgi:hypothetical protein